MLNYSFKVTVTVKLPFGLKLGLNFSILRFSHSHLQKWQKIQQKLRQDTKQNIENHQRKLWHRLFFLTELSNDFTKLNVGLLLSHTYGCFNMLCDFSWTLLKSPVFDCFRLFLSFSLPSNRVVGERLWFSLFVQLSFPAGLSHFLLCLMAPCLFSVMIILIIWGRVQFV